MITGPLMPLMPTIFFGHGSPRDALKDTACARRWRQVAATFPKPRAVVSISAHWECKGVLITRGERPRTIHDFYRAPEELYAIDYPAPGDPALAWQIEELLAPFNARADLDSWGLDHGTWTVLRNLYPDADVPALQVSIDVRRTPAQHHGIGRALGTLRDEGVLVMGTGNIVHNLKVPRPRGETFPWAERFDTAVVARLESGQHDALIAYDALPDAEMAVPESEHYLPLVYVLGASRPGETATIFNQEIEGTVSMTCVGFGLDQPALAATA